VATMRKLTMSLLILTLLIISALQLCYIIATYRIDAPLEDFYPALVADALYHITASNDVTLFEDGSFTIGGCLPFAICNEEQHEETHLQP